MAFGAFATAGQLHFAERLGSDDRDPGADRLFVRTNEGGLASVRILKRTHPTVEFTNVYRLPPEPGLRQPTQR